MSIRAHLTAAGQIAHPGQDRHVLATVTAGYRTAVRRTADELLPLLRGL
ncbi:hypothetical protein G3I19_21310 [Streptomyces sp. SID10853]|nr:hypothetical protein [Streptomyces sp. SID10853]NDZ81027.1 hypothetical protein [Streptomyces sp. SID10853]